MFSISHISCAFVKTTLYMFGFSVPGRKNTSEFPPDVSTLDLPEIPHLPDVPRSDTGTPQSDNWGTSTSGNDVDFDELSRRFEELKKRK